MAEILLNKVRCCALALKCNNVPGKSVNIKSGLLVRVGGLCLCSRGFNRRLLPGGFNADLI